MTCYSIYDFTSPSNLEERTLVLFMFYSPLIYFIYYLDLGLEEEYLFGSLNVTIHKLHGLQSPAGMWDMSPVKLQEIYFL